MSPREYWVTSRQPRYSVLFALPLLVLYEALAAAMSGSAFAGVRNGADVLLKTLFVSLGGRAGVFVFGLLLLGVGAFVVVRDLRSHGGRLNSRIFGGMFAESVVYALLLGTVVSLLTAWLLQGPLYTFQAPARQIPLGTQLVVSLGAGLYEELLFRVLLVWALVALAGRLGWGRPLAVGFGVVGSALIFSGFHYIGPLGDQLTLPSFTYRAVAGLLLSGLYVARGFGIVAWTHALYDVGVTLLGTG
jgi:membrane protease YdiL (CAAX protease family)